MSANMSYLQVHNHGPSRINEERGKLFHGIGRTKLFRKARCRVRLKRLRYQVRVTTFGTLVYDGNEEDYRRFPSLERAKAAAELTHPRRRTELLWRMQNEGLIRLCDMRGTVVARKIAEDAATNQLIELWSQFVDERLSVYRILPYRVPPPGTRLVFDTEAEGLAAFTAMWGLGVVRGAAK